MHARTGLIAAVCLGILGCASTDGRKVDTNAVVKIKEGSTSKDEAIRLLGPPTSTSRLPDGSESLQWRYAYSRSSAGGYAALGLGSTNTENNLLNMTVRNGVVESCLYTATHATGKGIQPAFGGGQRESNEAKCSDFRP